LTQHSPRGCPLRRAIRVPTVRLDVATEPKSSHRVDLSFKEYMPKRLAPYWLSVPVMSLAWRLKSQGLLFTVFNTWAAASL
jgi:hypothetical protein